MEPWTRQSDILSTLPLFIWGVLLRAGAGASTLHLLNLILHGTNAYLSARVLERWVADSKWAFLCGLLVLTAPLNIEAVVWISGVFDLLATSLVLAGMLIARRYEDHPTLGHSLHICRHRYRRTRIERNGGDRGGTRPGGCIRARGPLAQIACRHIHSDRYRRCRHGVEAHGDFRICDRAVRQIRDAKPVVRKLRISCHSVAYRRRAWCAVVADCRSPLPYLLIDGLLRRLRNTSARSSSPWRLRCGFCCQSSRFGRHSLSRLICSNPDTSTFQSQGGPRSWSLSHRPEAKEAI